MFLAFLMNVQAKRSFLWLLATLNLGVHLISKEIARSTPGSVGADLAALGNKASNLAMKRIIDGRKHELSQDLMDENTEGWRREPWSPDEMDKLAIKISDFELLIELDGAEQRQGVSVIGATNRPEVMDRAVLQPGRLGKLLCVSQPSPDERGLILKALARKKPADAGVDLNTIGRMEACENLSGADLAALRLHLSCAYMIDDVWVQSGG